ncbi:MAG: lipid-A-disaccharide synthase-related protein [Timaviella obliquedivisa GSE-PSE-MK23-08B]|jgi:uncharacterized protein (TIGR03492 family)|nr:lipid-A-disaccharide synthase-related protein [Timaviella obliquedivisa GSE-PSE-MK23-08B]
MKLLCLSNGHGEDAIALRIIQQLQQHPNCPQLAVLPLVGEGNAYANHGISILGQVKTMPSGGFIYMDGRQFARDLQGGLAQLTWNQIQTVRAWAKEGGMILAVGDIVPLLFAWWSGAPYAFVGTAKSEYYLRNEQGILPRGSWFEQLESAWGSVYLPWERWLMSRPQCKAVFPRDTLTAETLAQWSIPVFNFGNPMMDGLEPRGIDLRAQAGELTFVLLPGSRVPEAYENWEIILEAVSKLLKTFGSLEVSKTNQPLLESTYSSLRFLGAIAPTVSPALLCPLLERYDWTLVSQSISQLDLTFKHGNATLLLVLSAFNDCLHQADMAIAMAGTATEQFVGLGKPAFILSGKGPQFTSTFAEAQTRLLGDSVIWVEHPDQLPQEIQALLQDGQRLEHISENGQRRLGEPGASQRIARLLLKQLGALN